MKFFDPPVALLLIFLYANLLLKTAAVGFNGSCNANNFCNNSAGLYCLARREGGGSCACVKYAHYYPETGRCSQKIGGFCGKSMGSHALTLGALECPPHSVCISSLEDMVPVEQRGIAAAIANLSRSDTKCICDQKSSTIISWDISEGCTPFLKFGDKCIKSDTTHLCNHKQGMVCGKSRTCECVDSMDFNVELDRCATPLGGICEMRHSVHNTCGKNAMSTKLLEELKYLYYYYTKQTIGYDNERRSRILSAPSKCECFPGFIANAKDQCVATFGGSCSENSPCNKDESLSCIDGICQCGVGTMSTYSSSGGGCRLLPGAKCSLTKGPKCINEANCTNSQCQCHKGYSATSDGFCLLDYGSQCQSGHGGDQCNYFKGLACIDEECSCFDSSLKWTKTECVAAKEGNRCGDIEVTLSNAQAVNGLAYAFEAFIKSSQMGEVAAMGITRRKTMYVVGCSEGLECLLDSNSIHNFKHCTKK